MHLFQETTQVNLRVLQDTDGVFAGYRGREVKLYGVYRERKCSPSADLQSSNILLVITVTCLTMHQIADTTFACLLSLLSQQIGCVRVLTWCLLLHADGRDICFTAHIKVNFQTKFTWQKVLFIISSDNLLPVSRRFLACGCKFGV